MPMLGARSDLNYAALVIPVAILRLRARRPRIFGAPWLRPESHPLPLHGLIIHATVRHSLP
jgi:hypothetical protein